MPSGVYKHLKHKQDCQCAICKNKRGGYKGIKSHFSGHHHTEESIKKIREAKTGTHPTEETIRKMIKSATGHVPSEETCRKISVANTGKIRTKEAKKKYSEGNAGKIRTEEQKKRYSGVSKVRAKRLWQNPGYKEKQLKAIFKSLDIKPNKPEQLLNGLLQDLFPNQYKYVGDGSILIGYKNPDFINEPEHKIIEFFGDYWHSKEVTGRTRIQEEKQRTKHFTKYGYQTLIIWECELNDIEKLKKKIIKFTKKMS